MKVLLIFLLFLSCFAQEQTASLVGTVADQTNARVVTATVQIEFPSGTTKVVRVDKEGSFEFQGLSPGIYQLQIAAPGFQPRRVVDIQIRASEQRKLAVTLFITPPPACHEQICL